MRFKHVIGLSLVGAVILAALAFASLDVKEKKKSPNQKRESRIYRGIPEEPVRFRASLSAPRTTQVLPTVLQGDMVEYTLTVPNPSDKPLELKNPKSCCGIILTHVTALIPPGESGLVKAVIITDKLGGQTLEGYAQVETTDPERPLLRQDVSMEVTRVATLSPHKIILRGPHTSHLEGIATVTPEESYPFALTGIKARKGLHIAYNVKEMNDREGTSYLIQVTNTRKTAGVYRDMLYLQTDNPDRPELRIRVEGHIE